MCEGLINFTVILGFTVLRCHGNKKVDLRKLTILPLNSTIFVVIYIMPQVQSTDFELRIFL